MDHWEERAKQPGVAGVAKYMAAFIRFLKSSYKRNIWKQELHKYLQKKAWSALGEGL